MASGPGTSVVLCFHAVEDADSNLAVSRELLWRHLTRLAERKFEFVTATELVAVAERPGRRAAVTFDDGYRSVHEVALPILAELGVPATVFAIAGRVGATSELPGAGERPLLCWDELRRLRHLGWEIGSHTWSHPDLTSLDDDELEQELMKSSDAVRAQLGERCTALAYPYGRTDARVVAAVRHAGYDAAFTVPRRWSRPEPLLWPRVTVWRGDSPAATAFKSSAPVRAVRGSRLGAALLATVGAAARGSNA